MGDNSLYTDYKGPGLINYYRGNTRVGHGKASPARVVGNDGENTQWPSPGEWNMREARKDARQRLYGTLWQVLKRKLMELLMTPSYRATPPDYAYFYWQELLILKGKEAQIRTKARRYDREAYNRAYRESKGQEGA